MSLSIYIKTQIINIKFRGNISNNGRLIINFLIDFGSIVVYQKRLFYTQIAVIIH